jgi:formate dehydrogenase assembly factor FdhD
VARVATSGTKVIKAASTGTSSRIMVASDTGISTPVKACRNGMARV